METVRLTVLVVAVLALAGIGGALRACGSFTRATSASARVARAPRLIGPRLRVPLPRARALPTVAAERAEGSAAGAARPGTVRSRASRYGETAQTAASGADTVVDVLDRDDD